MSDLKRRLFGFARARLAPRAIEKTSRINSDCLRVPVLANTWCNCVLTVARPTWRNSANASTVRPVRKRLDERCFARRESVQGRHHRRQVERAVPFAGN
ncbi:MAG TPA: hypothetical protein PL196_10430 [Burkholderiaceae bacterium]|nr:hypothetical protein [Burkholderiaceae bacterium]